MATTNTIGTASRDYSTMQAWEDAVPATPTGGYEGHAYNDSEFTARTVIDGHTTSATDYILLTAASGQSFQDHASVRSNALFYDQSKGVGIASNPGSAGDVLQINNDYVTVSRLQIKRTAASYGNTVLHVTTGNMVNVLVKDCIIQKAFSAAVDAATIRTSKIVNCLVVNTGATVGTGISLARAYGNLGSAINCTVVNTAAAGGTGIASGGYANQNNINNCYVGGYSTAASGSPLGNYNATDQATVSGLPGANSVANLAMADQFENSSSDFRLKSGSSLIGAGNTDATNAPNDISATARGSGTAGDIGAWEATAAASGQPMSIRGRGVPGMRLGGATFGQGY